jgi:hypothetical protein
MGAYLNPDAKYRLSWTFVGCDYWQISHAWLTVLVLDAIITMW